MREGVKKDGPVHHAESIGDICAEKDMGVFCRADCSLNRSGIAVGAVGHRVLLRGVTG